MSRRSRGLARRSRSRGRPQGAAVSARLVESGPFRGVGSALALGSLTAAGLVAAVRLAVSFDHGIWLAAYLFLVGFLAQILLSTGWAVLLPIERVPPLSRTARVQLALWNAGVVAVPVGVMFDARLAVVSGGVALLAALWSFAWAALTPARGAASGRLRHAYLVLVVLLACSVLIGVALGWDRPWV